MRAPKGKPARIAAVMGAARGKRVEPLLREISGSVKLLEGRGEAVQRGHGLGAGPRGSEGRARRSRGARRGELGKKELTCGTDGSASERGSVDARERAERLTGGPNDRGWLCAHTEGAGAGCWAALKLGLREVGLLGWHWVGLGSCFWFPFPLFFFKLHSN